METFKDLTSTQIDSIHHSQINDSINALDTIKVLGSLFMGMTPDDYSINKDKVSLPLKIGRLEFSSVDTLMYHNLVHGIRLSAYLTDHPNNVEDMAYYILWGEETFHEVLKTLSNKYGNNIGSRRLEVFDDERRWGLSMWEFDKFSVEYKHEQTPDIINNKHYIRASITYSIPRIPTAEEEHRTDSIIAEHDRKVMLEKQRNDAAIRSL